MDIFKNRDYFLFDGAMGTYYALKYNNNIACEFANICDESSILKIHKEYIQAGSQAIKTNTFGANRFSLACEQSEAEEIIKKGWDIAIKAAEGTNALVFADIGPIPVPDDVPALDEYKKIVDIFFECGAEHFLFETFSHCDILLELCAYIRHAKPEAVIITSFAVYPDGYTKEGQYYKDVFEKMSASGLADAMGLNCISGPAHMYRLINDLDIGDRIISVMPNSGYPSSERGRIVYVDNPEYFAQKILDLKYMGIKILGGCCGTTPGHIASAAGLLSDSNSQNINSSHPKYSAANRSPGESLLNKPSHNKKNILVEIDPPFDTDWEYMLKDALLLKQAGADIITISDSPLAKARADSAIMAAKIQREAAISVMPHITCRDKNLLGIKATLIGLNIEGVRNVLAVTGDPIANLERKSIKGVFSINSSNLANYITSLNSNIFGSKEFQIGGALNVNAVNFDAEIKRSIGKIENGMSFLLTQAAYTAEAVENIIRAAEELKVPVYAGIMPLVGYKNAQFINNEVPGMKIDDETIGLFKDKSREESERIGIDISMKTIAKLVPYVAGFYLMTPLKRTYVICELIKKIKEIEV